MGGTAGGPAGRLALRRRVRVTTVGFSGSGSVSPCLKTDTVYGSVHYRLANKLRNLVGEGCVPREIYGFTAEAPRLS